MAAHKNTASRARIAAIDLPAILDRFTDARCVLECACRALENAMRLSASVSAYACWERSTMS